MTWQLSRTRAERKAALEAAGYKCGRCGHISKNGKGLLVVNVGDVPVDLLMVLCTTCHSMIGSKPEPEPAFKPDIEARNKDWYAWVYGGQRNPQT